MRTTQTAPRVAVCLEAGSGPSYHVPAPFARSMRPRNGRCAAMKNLRYLYKENLDECDSRHHRVELLARSAN